MQTCSDMDALVTATYNQLIAVQALKTGLITFYATIAQSVGGATDDFTVYSRAGLDGTESWTRQSLLERIDKLTEEEKSLTETYATQIALRNKMFPNIRVDRHPGLYRYNSCNW